MVLLCLSLGLISSAQALVYRCVHPSTGAVSYQDFICGTPNDLNQVLAIDYDPTPKAALAKSRQQSRKRAQQQALRLQKKMRRQQQQTENNKRKAEKRATWYQTRCESARAKKAALEDRFRQGYSATEEPVLRETLKQHETRIAKYCVKPSP